MAGGEGQVSGNIELLYQEELDLLDAAPLQPMQEAHGRHLLPVWNCTPFIGWSMSTRLGTSQRVGLHFRRATAA